MKDHTASKYSHINQKVASFWGFDGWQVRYHSPIKNGKIWIVTDAVTDHWDLVKWDGNEWTSERGLDLNWTHCKPLSISNDIFKRTTIS